MEEFSKIEQYEFETEDGQSICKFASVWI